MLAELKGGALLRLKTFIILLGRASLEGVVLLAGVVYVSGNHSTKQSYATNGILLY